MVMHAAVKISGIIIKAADHVKQGPLKVKLFINKPTIGFGDAASVPATQDFKLSEAQLAGETVPLK